ncbi:hypothetical protein PMAYCL1PPCAC_26487, partial [Pristionchus mayeri]
ENKASNHSIILSCCWLIRNVMEGTKDHIQEIISNGLLRKIVEVMQAGDSDCQEQCSWALYHLVMKGTYKQIISLLNEKPMPAMSAVLAHTDRECIYDALYMIDKLLSIFK